MLSPFKIPCNADVIRGQLRHHWLENQILNKTPEDVLFILQTEERWDALETEFEQRIAQAIKFTDDMIEGFSPKQLFDKIEILSSISNETKMLLKDKIHKVYIEKSNIQNISISFQCAVKSLEGAIKEFKKMWKQSKSERNEAITEMYQAVLDSATLLHDVIKLLPKGVVLP
jgi:hypothetical protein